MRAPTDTAVSLPVLIKTSGVVLNGDLTLPAEATGLVVFAHGSGSSRHSSHNVAVAQVLQHARLGTLLLDLLTEGEERTDVVTAEYRFDVGMLGKRVVGAIDWALASRPTSSLAIGLFGASTGAAAALIAAATRPEAVRAVVSRGGRPDLADQALERVTAPTLLIVGGRDEVVIDLNRQALARLNAPKELRIVPDATHLFEEPGTLEEVSRLARDWFLQHLQEG
jgi:putative phosphoribosyl transferase